MNIRLFSLSACLSMGAVSNICANRIPLLCDQLVMHDEHGNKVIYDSKDKKLWGIPDIPIYDTDIYGFVTNASESPMQFINKCTWERHMELTGHRLNWLNHGMLPSGFTAKDIYVYQLAEDGTYHFQERLSSTTQICRNVIIPQELQQLADTQSLGLSLLANRVQRIRRSSLDGSVCLDENDRQFMHDILTVLFGMQSSNNARDRNYH